MKLTNKKLAFFAVTLILGVLIGAISFNTSSNVKADDEEKNKITFTKQGYFKEIDDNWIYYFDILDYEGIAEKQYIFDGYNMKYTYLNDYSIKMINAETNEIEDKIISETPILSRSDTHGDEIIRINKYFTSKQFKNAISLSDLNDLETAYISKSLLVEMFNNAIISDVSNKPGKYIYFSHLGKVFADSLDDTKKGEWELTYINDYGYIKYVTIDLKYEDGTYLSDSGEYSELLTRIEKDIEKKQSFENISVSGLSENMGLDINNLLTATNKEVSME